MTKSKLQKSDSFLVSNDLKSIKKWNIDITLKWLSNIGYNDCTKYFREHKINGRALLMLNEDDLKEIIKHNVGQRKNLYHIIKQLQLNFNKSTSSFFESDSETSELTDFNEENDDLNSSINVGSGLGINKSPKINLKSFSEEVQPNLCENCYKVYHQSYDPENTTNNCPIRNFRGEKRRTLVSVIYLFLTCLWTSFMLTVVHDRVPDMEKYPPLPDIILDNVPLIPWAFFATELIGLALVIMFLVLLIFHKYRMIIFRRMCSLGGTIFILRSITMLITSLSVPGVHIQCSSQRYGSFINKLNGAWSILSGGGLYVQGVRTCGDYMFSGHTVWLTLLSHFITEYTPRSMYWLHTTSWIMNIFGLFFILGAHEHYSIDVFVAFYITSRLFLYYHSLANNLVLFQSDHKRVKVWFPLFSYFESNTKAMVPNEYQNPLNFFYKIYKFIRNKCKKLFIPSIVYNCSAQSYSNTNSQTTNNPCNNTNNLNMSNSKKNK
ncbi:unnamed protein product [Brachionus calyciflorus]|uniref:SAM domain-containing protein n=1 Tax=Brachionus calyciflorus TaxID=104777 RepID=A0A813RZM3_9BILA|nr:unnamed protein product [Brachionus calyciflorus]